MFVRKGGASCSRGRVLFSKVCCRGTINDITNAQRRHSLEFHERKITANEEGPYIQ